MSPTLSGQEETTPPLPTMKGSKELCAKSLHLDTGLLQQELPKKVENILTILKGVDMGVIKKLRTSVADVITRLRVTGERLEEISVFHQQKRECSDYIQAKRKGTNATIKIQHRNMPVEERKSPEEVRIGMILQEISQQP